MGLFLRLDVDENQCTGIYVSEAKINEMVRENDEEGRLEKIMIKVLEENINKMVRENGKEGGKIMIKVLEKK